jgi:hypothetical protein
MKIHTERPAGGKARLAWDYFTEQRGAPPLDMSYSHWSDFDEGPAWVATYPQQARWGCDVGCDPSLASVAPKTLDWWASTKSP